MGFGFDWGFVGVVVGVGVFGGCCCGGFGVLFFWCVVVLVFWCFVLCLFVFGVWWFGLWGGLGGCCWWGW
ncbi:hypothetical protein, partial [Pseudomonas syringae group genomosp. 7]|uniref:hypothetical protein n=1 Tax=Pseudomonas syringae group genomosp. 7 TaxID=251699 RepID=UPI0037702DCA